MKKSTQKIEWRTRGRGNATATVDITVQNVNDAPVATVRFGAAANEVFEGRRAA